MNIDYKLAFSYEQAITATANSTNVYKQNTYTNEFGNTTGVASTAQSYGLKVAIGTNVGFVGLTELIVHVEGSNTENGTYAIITSYKLDTFELEKIKQNKAFVTSFPFPDTQYKFIRLRYQVTGTITAGTLYAYITSRGL